jgi:hypothetical protein
MRGADSPAAGPAGGAVLESPATGLVAVAASPSWLTGWNGDASGAVARLSALPMEVAIGWAQAANGMAGALMGEALVQSARCCEQAAETLRLPAAPWSMADWWGFQSNIWMAALDTVPPRPTDREGSRVAPIGGDPRLSVL